MIGGDFDFAHVPVGLLSQVYEAFCWKWEPQNAEATSVYYTPRNIAATLVNEAFDNVPNAKDCKVLDPACGAGLFLVLAFRRIYREQWKATSQRPDTKSIRDILDHQLTGFEISDAALKFSALSLYLTAIELDPEPIPPEKLTFNKLQSVRLEAPFSPGAVLYNVRRDEPEGRMVIGSLGDHVGGGFDGRFDLILSNPPWTSLPKTEKVLAKELDKLSQSIISRRCQRASLIYRNPDHSPDLPFLWKSTEWCKPGGRIAMALPARTLFKQSKPSRQAREALFRQIEITGIINCSNLRKTNVWPDMDQPFMLLFARNLRPNKGHSLHFVSPHTEKTLNALGEVRIDAESATPVEVEASLKEPWLWKALAVGTPLDIEIIRKIKASGWGPFQRYWQKDLGLVSRSGYQIKPKQRQQDAKPLQELRDLDSTDLFPFVVDTHQLAKKLRCVKGLREEAGRAIERERAQRPATARRVDSSGRPVGAPDSIFAEKVLPLAIETGATRIIATLSEGLDSDHSAGVHYCGKGIIRFVRGEYAWAMNSALMIGYARTGYTIFPKLTDALKASSIVQTLDYPYQCRRSRSSASSEVVQISRHARTFTYVETKRPAKAITIRHLWLRRD